MKKIILLLLALTNLLIINSCQKDIEAPINTVSVTDNVVPGGSTAIISGTIECPVTITRIELYIDIAEDMPNPTKYDIETRQLLAEFAQREQSGLRVRLVLLFGLCGLD